MDKTINFRISEEQKAKLQLNADDLGLKISSLIRSIITDYLDDYDGIELVDDRENSFEVYPSDIKITRTDDWHNFTIS
jgi:predicted DNA-binding protein